MKVSAVYSCKGELNKEFCFEKPKGTILPQKGTSEEFRDRFLQELDKYIEEERIGI